jgi:hypothetical protein
MAGFRFHKFGCWKRGEIVAIADLAVTISFEFQKEISEEKNDDGSDWAA